MRFGVTNGVKVHDVEGPTKNEDIPSAFLDAERRQICPKCPVKTTVLLLTRRN